MLAALVGQDRVRVQHGNVQLVKRVFDREPLRLRADAAPLVPVVFQADAERRAFAGLDVFENDLSRELVADHDREADPPALVLPPDIPLDPLRAVNERHALAFVKEQRRVVLVFPTVEKQIDLCSSIAVSDCEHPHTYLFFCFCIKVIDNKIMF